MVIWNTIGMGEALPPPPFSRLSPILKHEKPLLEKSAGAFHKAGGCSKLGAIHRHYRTWQEAIWETMEYIKTVNNQQRRQTQCRASISRSLRESVALAATGGMTGTLLYSLLSTDLTVWKWLI
jgi:hypothetical protein